MWCVLSCFCMAYIPPIFDIDPLSFFLWSYRNEATLPFLASQNGDKLRPCLPILLMMLEPLKFGTTSTKHCVLAGNMEMLGHCLGTKTTRFEPVFHFQRPEMKMWHLLGLFNHLNLLCIILSAPPPVFMAPGGIISEDTGSKNGSVFDKNLKNLTRNDTNWTDAAISRGVW